MRKIQKFGLAAVAAAGLAGVAAAKAPGTAVMPATHVMTVPLPDGSVARLQYAGDVAPRVTVAPVTIPQIGPGADIPMRVAMPSMDGLFAQFDQQMAAAMQQIDLLSRQAISRPGTAASVAAYGQPPAGTTSYSTVTVNENGRQCTRSIQVIGDGPDKPPRVTTNVSGDCAGVAGPAAVPAEPIHRS